MELLVEEAIDELWSFTTISYLSYKQQHYEHYGPAYSNMERNCDMLLMRGAGGLSLLVDKGLFLGNCTKMSLCKRYKDRESFMLRKSRQMTG